MEMSKQNMDTYKEKEVAAIIGSIVKNLECAICLRLPTDPVSIGCGHFYCRECITTVLKRNFRASCPLCMKPYTKRSIQEASQRKSICSALNRAVDTIETILGIDILSASNKLNFGPKPQEKAHSEVASPSSATQILNELAEVSAPIAKDKVLQVNSVIVADGKEDTTQGDLYRSKSEDKNCKKFENYLSNFSTARNMHFERSQEEIKDSEKSNECDIDKYFDCSQKASITEVENDNAPSTIINDVPESNNIKSINRANIPLEFPLEVMENHIYDGIQNENRLISHSNKMSKTKGKKFLRKQETAINLTKHLNVKTAEINLSKEDNDNILNRPITTIDSQNPEEILSFDVEPVQEFPGVKESKLVSNNTKCQDNHYYPLEMEQDLQEQEPQSPVSNEPAEFDPQNEDSRNTPLLCRSPGWSRIKQMNQDFHLKTFPFLCIQKKKPPQFHPRVKVAEDQKKNTTDVSDNSMTVSKKQGESSLSQSNIQGANNSNDSTEKYNLIPIPVNIVSGNKNTVSQVVELKKICSKFISSYLNHKSFEQNSDGVLENNNVPEPDMVKAVKKSRDGIVFEMPVNIETRKAIGKRLSDVTQDPVTMSGRKKKRTSKSTSSEDVFLSSDSRNPNPYKEKSKSSDQKFTIFKKSTVSDVTSTHSKIKQHESFHHVKTMKQNNSGTNKRLSDHSPGTKVVKRICFTLDEILFHFKKCNSSGETQMMSSVPLPFSEFHLQLDVTDQTLNISVLKNLKNAHMANTAASSDSLSFSSCDGYEPGPHSLIHSVISNTTLSSKSRKKNQTQSCLLSETEENVDGVISPTNFPPQRPISVSPMDMLKKIWNNNEAQPKILRDCNADAPTKQKEIFDCNRNSQIDTNIPDVSFAAPTLACNFPSGNDESKIHDTTTKTIISNRNSPKNGAIASDSHKSCKLSLKTKLNPESEKKVIECQENGAIDGIREKMSFRNSKSPSRESPTAKSTPHLQILPHRQNISPMHNEKKTYDSLGDEMLSEDIDPFADSCEPANCAGVPFSVFDQLMEESDGYASDPDMLFANDLVAPLKNMAKKLHFSEKTTGIVNITNKSSAKKSKRFKRITTVSSSEDSEDSSDIPTQPFITREKREVFAKNTTILSAGGTEGCLTFSQDANTGEVDRMRLEIAQMNARIMELEKEISEDDLDNSEESDSEMVKPTNSQERTCNRRNAADEVHSDDSKESSELFTELIPPTPPTHH